MLLYFYKEVAMKVLVYGVLLSGLITWVIGRDSYHIGASGLIYVLFSFTFFSGIIKGHFRLIAASLVIIFLYGSMVWYVLPIKEGVSWEGHLSGFIIGGLFSLLFRKIGIQKEKFVFSKTEFDDMFDEYGNFSPPEESDQEEDVAAFNYTYIYKEEE